MVRMKKNRRKYLILLGLTLLIMLTLLAVTTFSCGFDTKIKNGTEQVLTIYYDSGLRGTLVSLGDVEPGGYVSRYCDMSDGYCQIDAHNNEGEVIFSREYFWRELREMDCEVVITPSED